MNIKYLIFGLLLFSISASASALPVTWTDWDNITSTGATGNLGGVGVTVSSTILNGPSQTDCGTNYWTEPNSLNPAYTGGDLDTAPTNCEQIGINSATSVTVSFDQTINNLYMALLSVGQPNFTVTYDFDTSFTVDSDGIGYWSFANGGNPGPYSLGAGDTISMNEFHGVLEFDYPITSLSFTTNPGENWHAFTFGTTDVPEPSILALFGLGLAGLIGFTRRIKKQR